jgi:hypothetical protein
MKQLFSLPEKYSQGFQINVKEFNFDQIEHCKEIFKARGVPFETKQALNDWLIYTEWSGVVKFYSASSVNLPVITYPELCRGAVQLEHGNWTKMYSIAERENLILYAANTAEMAYLYENGAHINTKRILFQVPSGKIAVVGLSDYTAPFSHLFLSPEQFEAKLRGISPVVRETENQSADNAQCKRYLKSTDNECVVEFIQGTIEGRFKGRVMERGQGGLSKGYVYDGFFCDQFEPYEYSPTIEVVERVEQPKETIADCDKKTLMDNPTIADHIGSHFNLAFDYAKALVNENTSLRQENTRLKNDAKTDQATISRINEKLDEANEDKQELEQENAQLKELNQSLASRNIYTIDQQEQTIAQLKEQVEELTQQVFDLNRLGANFERENAQLKQQQENTWSEKETLKNALAKIAELESQLKQPIENSEQLPVYDVDWLDKVVKVYGKSIGTCYFYKNGLVGMPVNGLPYLDPKTSSNVIMAALAKKLNPMFEAEDKNDAWFISIEHGQYEVNKVDLHYVKTSDSIFASSQAAQKAIYILNSINPKVLKNYFQL